MRDCGLVGRQDEIQLELPAAVEYGRVARIAAAHLALRRGFSLNEIDDLRLVMDEAAAMLLRGRSGDGRLEVTYAIDADTVHVTLRVVADDDTPVAIEGVDRFAERVGELVDTYTIDRSARTLTLTKARFSA